VLLSPDDPGIELTDGRSSRNDGRGAAIVSSFLPFSNDGATSLGRLFSERSPAGARWTGVTGEGAAGVLGDSALTWSSLKFGPEHGKWHDLFHFWIALLADIDRIRLPASLQSIPQYIEVPPNIEAKRIISYFSAVPSY
jgi:hypothetical protein